VTVAALDATALARVEGEIARLRDEDDGVATLVVGLPRRLDGRPTEMTTAVEAFAHRLAEKCALPLVLQDERLSSHEADSRLATREKDWRVRKRKLDAASAAVILQDYLDARSGGGVRDASGGAEADEEDRP
jgi:putative Holliday junction resolvase